MFRIHDLHTIVSQCLLLIYVLISGPRTTVHPRAIRNAASWASPQAYESETLRGEPAVCLTIPLGDSDACSTV